MHTRKIVLCSMLALATACDGSDPEGERSLQPYLAAPGDDGYACQPRSEQALIDPPPSDALSVPEANDAPPGPDGQAYDPPTGERPFAPVLCPEGQEPVALTTVPATSTNAAATRTAVSTPWGTYHYAGLNKATLSIANQGVAGY